MERRSFLWNVAAGVAGPIAVKKNVCPKCMLAKEKIQWRMVTQFRVNPKQQEFARIIAAHLLESLINVHDNTITISGKNDPL